MIGLVTNIPQKNKKTFVFTEEIKLRKCTTPDLEQHRMCKWYNCYFWVSCHFNTPFCHWDELQKIPKFIILLLPMYSGLNLWVIYLSSLWSANIISIVSQIYVPGKRFHGWASPSSGPISRLYHRGSQWAPLITGFRLFPLTPVLNITCQ